MDLQDLGYLADRIYFSILLHTNEMLTILLEMKICPTSNWQTSSLHCMLFHCGFDELEFKWIYIQLPGFFCSIVWSPKDWMPNGFDTPSLGLQGGLHICRATIVIKALHGAILWVHWRHVRPIWHSILQFIFVRISVERVTKKLPN